jgi:hypothetical protein
MSLNLHGTSKCINFGNWILKEIQKSPAAKHREDSEGCKANRARDENSRVSTPLDYFILYMRPSPSFFTCLTRNLQRNVLIKKCFMNSFCSILEGLLVHLKLPSPRCIWCNSRTNPTCLSSQWWSLCRKNSGVTFQHISFLCTNKFNVFEGKSDYNFILFISVVIQWVKIAPSTWLKQSKLTFSFLLYLVSSLRRVELYIRFSHTSSFPAQRKLYWHHVELH